MVPVRVALEKAPFANARWRLPPSARSRIPRRPPCSPIGCWAAGRQAAPELELELIESGRARIGDDRVATALARFEAALAGTNVVA